MNKRFLVTTLLVLNFTCYGQHTKKIIKTKSSYVETYYVLKSDKSTKHGDYKREVRGVTLVRGLYKNGEQTGIWEYYSANGELTQKLDIKTKELIYDKFEDDNKNFDRTKYSRPIILLGGRSMFYHMALVHLRYPHKARTKGTQGRVMVKFNVDEEGNMINPEVVEGIGNGCDKEALRVVKLLELEWLPALDTQGKPMKSELIMPINFRIG